MKMQFIFSFIFIILLHAVENANILAIFPYPGKSHFTVFKPMLMKLVVRGHKLDVMSHFPLKKLIAGYNDISLEGTMKISTNNIEVKHLKATNFVENLQVVYKIAGTDICEAVLKSDQARNLLNSTKKYDLLLTHEVPGGCMYGFGEVFNVPIVTVTTSVNLPWTSNRIGLPDNPTYIPNYFSSYGPKMRFMERFWNTVMLVVSKISHNAHEQEIEQISKKFFGDKISSIKEISRNISLMLVNSHFSIQQPRPIVPNFVEVAGIHINEHFSLPEHLKESMNTSNVIYLSFGSMIMTETLPEDILKAMFDTFKELPYKVLWKADRNLFPEHLKIPTNIQFETWMPQLGILCHPNTKLFISHGGMLGTQESNYCGIPVLGIPIFGDQSLNINNNVVKGIALELKFEDISKESFSTAVRTLLEPKHKNKAEEISKIFKDRPFTALDTAIYWIEYVIRHNGAQHLRNQAVALQWYEYYLLDVISFAIAIMVGFCSILCYCLKCLLCSLISALRKKKIKEQ